MSTKVKIMYNNSCKVMTHQCIYNKLLLMKLLCKPPKAQIWPPSYCNLKTWNWEGVSSTAQWGEKQEDFRNDIILDVEKNMLFFKYQTGVDNKRYSDITINSQLKQSLCPAKDLTLG